MTSATFTLSAFGDEIAVDLQEQLELLQELRIAHLELRAAWGKNVLYLDDDEVREVGRTCRQYGVSVSCIGSPIGKSPIDAPIETELSNLARIFRVAEDLNTHRVRIFSFYPPDPEGSAEYDQYLDKAVSRLARLASMAGERGFLLLLENERAIVGDTVSRCRAILSAVDSPHLRFLWDPANFVVVGEAKPTDRGWPSLGPYVAHVHVKDAVLADGTVTPAGGGDGQLPQLLSALQGTAYQGFLALEPHLKVAGHSSGFSGPEGMRVAVGALRQLMAQVGCQEMHAPQESAAPDGIP
jgi:sugar phosphate isomerase/epimerase